MSMSDESEGHEVATDINSPTEAKSTEVNNTAEPRESMPPVESRFMFVDISAMRAKQLRRGALPRLSDEVREAEGLVDSAKRFERIAMREVEEGLIEYDIPEI